MYDSAIMNCFPFQIILNSSNILFGVIQDLVSIITATVNWWKGTVTSALTEDRNIIISMNQLKILVSNKCSFCASGLCNF